MKWKPDSKMEANLTAWGVKPHLHQAVIDCVKAGEDPPALAYAPLYRHFAMVTQEMPYGTARAKDGCPDEWLLMHLQFLWMADPESPQDFYPGWESLPAPQPPALQDEADLPVETLSLPIVEPP